VDLDEAPPPVTVITTPAPVPPPSVTATTAPQSTRNDLQLGRRLFHFVNGFSTATAYALFFTHEQVIHIFGTIACIVYVLDRIRIAYPEVVERRVPWVNRILVRAEEQVREAAMTPYAIAVLLTILTFPKPAALVAIYTLGIADPAAALVGIRFGRRKLSANRSFEGRSPLRPTVVVAAAVSPGAWTARRSRSPARRSRSDSPRRRASSCRSGSTTT
jgi:hypothetical protein